MDGWLQITANNLTALLIDLGKKKAAKPPTNKKDSMKEPSFCLTE
jgi:hypothetical protein